MHWSQTSFTPGAGLVLQPEISLSMLPVKDMFQKGQHPFIPVYRKSS